MVNRKVIECATCYRLYRISGRSMLTRYYIENDSSNCCSFKIGLLRSILIYEVESERFPVDGDWFKNNEGCYF